MGGAALEEGELDGPGLAAQTFLHGLGEEGGGPAHLLVAKGIGRGSPRAIFRDKGALAVVNALGHSHQAVVLFAPHPGDIP